MAIYFVDSSALVKRYISEIGSTWVLELFDFTQDNEFFIAAITAVEIIAAITRRMRGGSISSADATLVCNQFKSDLQTDYQIIEISEALRDRRFLIHYNHKKKCLHNLNFQSEIRNYFFA